MRTPSITCNWMISFGCPLKMPSFRHEDQVWGSSRAIVKRIRLGDKGQWFNSHCGPSSCSPFQGLDQLQAMRRNRWILQWSHKYLAIADLRMCGKCGPHKCQDLLSSQWIFLFCQQTVVRNSQWAQKIGKSFLKFWKAQRLNWMIQKKKFYKSIINRQITISNDWKRNDNSFGLVVTSWQTFECYYFIHLYSF